MSGTQGGKRHDTHRERALNLHVGESARNAAPLPEKSAPETVANRPRRVSHD
jgi:hypothetical protein